MILRSGGKNREVRDMFSAVSTIPPPAIGAGRGGWSYSGRLVGPEQAVGLPAALSAIRLLAETIGALPMVVYRGTGDERERALDVPQWELLHLKPNESSSPFDVWSYIIASLQSRGGGYLLKTKARGRVQELYPLNPAYVTPIRQNNELVFRYAPPRKPGDASTQPKTLTRRDITYIPGILLFDPLIGVSPIEAHRQSLGSALAQEEYEGRFWANDASPRGILSLENTPSSDKRRELREAWESQHRGTANSHKTALMWGGAKYEPISLSMRDAQFIESQKFSIEQVARIFRVPGRLLGASDQEPRITPEQHAMEFLTLSLMPWLVRLEQALHRDDDLFPDKDLFPEFLPDGLLRADTASRYDAYVKARQAGWLSANEIRRMENLPPVEGGDEVQATPVGGAPNDKSSQPATNEVGQ